MDLVIFQDYISSPFSQYKDKFSPTAKNFFLRTRKPDIFAVTKLFILHKKFQEFVVFPSPYFLSKDYKDFFPLIQKIQGYQIVWKRNCKFLMGTQGQKLSEKKEETWKDQNFEEYLMRLILFHQNLITEQERKVEVSRLKVDKLLKWIDTMTLDSMKEVKKARKAVEFAKDAIPQGYRRRWFITEVKSYPSPPYEIEMVMYPVMIILEKDRTWMSVLREISDPQFFRKILEFDIDQIRASTLKRIERYTKKEEFNPEYTSKKLELAGTLCSWVRAIEDYGKALRVVRPKLMRKEYAKTALSPKMREVKTSENVLKLMKDKLGFLQDLLLKAKESLALKK